MSAPPSRLPQLRIEAGDLAEAVAARLERWQAEAVPRRLWQRDPTVWSQQPVAELADRLGWLELPARMEPQLGELEALAAAADGEGFSKVVLIGMGGSSLGAEMLQSALGRRRRLEVADSTHPAAIGRLAAGLDPQTTLFVVSSKSGTTVETEALQRYFWDWSESHSGAPAQRFVAVTDGGTPLAERALELGFRALFEAPPDVGGRFSALGPFGLVPAALCGLAVERVVASGAAMAARCGPEVAAADNPGMRLGALMGEAARAGRDLLRLAASPALAAFAPWLEQLVAESTGKRGRGVLPVAAEPPEAAGPAQRGLLAVVGEVAAEQAALPRAEIAIDDPADLGAEVFRWELAVAMAAAVLGVQPFDQPDVQLAKDLARRAAAGDAEFAPPPPVPAAAAEPLPWLEPATGGYVAIQAFLAPEPAVEGLLERLRRAVGGRTGLPATAGYGPRFLHSTGQLHKGGPDGGRFLQLIDQPGVDVVVPGSDLTFGRLLRAQADGDAAALAHRRRPLLRVDLGPSPAEALAELVTRCEAG